MTKFKTYLALCLIVGIYSSCVVQGPQINLYGPAMYTNDISYQPKPLSANSVHHANYISASFFTGSPPNSINSDDELTSGQINIGQGFTFTNFNVSYGVFAGVGSYSNQTNNNSSLPNYFSSKFFGDAGARFSANTFITSGRVDIRFIGFEMAYSHEFGDYADYRKSLSGVPNYFTDASTDLITLGGTSEVIWHSGKQQLLQFGFRVFIGRTLGNNYYKNVNTPNQIYYPELHPSSLAYFM